MTKQEKNVRRQIRKKKAQKIILKYWPVFVVASAAVALVIAGFLVPPTGIIDGSVLKACGELIGIMGIFVFIVRAESGADITFRKGDMEVTVNNDDITSVSTEMGAEMNNDDFNV